MLHAYEDHVSARIAVRKAEMNVQVTLFQQTIIPLAYSFDGPILVN